MINTWVGTPLLRITAMESANPAFKKYGIGHCRICSSTYGIGGPVIDATVHRAGICGPPGVVLFDPNYAKAFDSKATFPIFAHESQATGQHRRIDRRAPCGCAEISRATPLAQRHCRRRSQSKEIGTDNAPNTKWGLSGPATIRVSF